ncbi:MAG: permease-like cell division protein FtsX [Nitrospirota bacterium]|nr:permease-like cell division protein FtsX [Nitrospirota bacterium]
MRQFYYHLKTALENIQLNQTMGFFSLISLGLTLMLFGVFLLFYENVQGFVQSMRESVQFSIYLKDGANQSAIHKLKEGLNDDQRILSSTYISKKEALKIFNASFHDKGLIERLGENPLPASFEVIVKADYQEAKSLEEIIATFAGFSGVEEVQYGSEWLENLNTFLNLLRLVGVGIGGFLVVTVTTNIANTIRLHFYNRREEIEIMKLIGATHGFIKIPFFIEGLLMGAMSSVISILLLFFLFDVAKDYLEVFLASMGSLEGLQFLPIKFLLGMILAGSTLGGIGSYISLSHLLRLRNPDYVTKTP